MPAARLLQRLAGSVRQNGRTALQFPGAGIQVDNAQVGANQGLYDGCCTVGHISAAVPSLMQRGKATRTNLVGQSDDQLSQTPISLARQHHARQRIKPASILSCRDENELWAIV